MKLPSRIIIRILSVFIITGLCSCASSSQVLDPFYEPPAPVALLGNPNDHELGGSGGGKEATARKALEQMASYQNQHTPQPVKPVLQPAVVRLMWIPDHLNSHGDLVPAHYYYLRVMNDRLAVTDAFELEGQLGSHRSTSNIPYVYKKGRRKK